MKKARITKQEQNYGYDSIFPTTFRKLLDERGKTQEELADFVGVSRQSIAQWKDGKTKPDILYLTKIAKFFDVSADYLLGRQRAETMDISLAAACEYLGLSVKAVQKLSYLCNYDFADILLTETGFISSLIHKIGAYVETLKPTHESRIARLESEFLGCISEKDATKYLCVNELSKVLENLEEGLKNGNDRKEK